MDILGYPTLFFKADARIPAQNAPINAAAAGGIHAKSTSSRRSVFDIAPITAADAASTTGLLNIIENPKTPQKLIINLRKRCNPTDILSTGKSIGLRFSSNAIIHAVIVATIIITSAYTSLSIPDLISSFAKSIPLVINGNPGIIKSMEQIYPA